MRPRLTVLLGATLSAFLAVLPAGRAIPETVVEQRPTDHAVVANYLAAFCRYVTWPSPATGGDPGAPLRIGVLGPNPFGSGLDKVLAGKSLGGRPLTAVYASGLEQLTDCQVVFIGYSEGDTRSAALAALAGKPVLTVLYRGELADAPATGAAIELVRVRSNIRYLLNSAALGSQGLQPTPGLLENALRRIGAPTP